MSWQMDLVEEVNSLKAQRGELEAKLAIAVEALEYYANGRLSHKDEVGSRHEFGCGCCAATMEAPPPGSDYGPQSDCDNRVIGLTAREALQKIRGEKV